MTTDAISGRVWLFGDDVNTDVLHPPQFFSLDPERVKLGLFHGIDPSLQARLAPGDVIVAGRNFGCGSSRETSLRSFKLNQIGAVVALDFARIFFRNATNNGLPCLTVADASALARVRQGMRVTISPAAACMELEDGAVIALDPPGEFVRKIWSAGGLLELLPAVPA
jgi:3-isopropylmalate dehydratase small subunit